MWLQSLFLLKLLVVPFSVQKTEYVNPITTLSTRAENVSGSFFGREDWIQPHQNPFQLKIQVVHFLVQNTEEVNPHINHTTGICRSKIWQQSLMLIKRHLVSFLVRILYKSTSPQPIATSAAGVYEKQSLILLKMHAVPFRHRGIKD